MGMLMKKNENIDWRELNLEKEEIDLLESVENGEWKSIGNIEKRREELRKFFAKDYNLSTDSGKITLNISKKDIASLKSKSKLLGISYDMLISKLIHNYAQGKINVSL